MPQTLTGWILIAAVILGGAGGGYMAARMVTTMRDGKVVDRSDVVVTLEFVGLMMVAGLLLWLVDGR